MNRTGEQLPRGFQGPIAGWKSLVPTAERCLQLPRDLEQVRASSVSASLDLVEVVAFTESAGRIEDAMADLARRLEPGGTLLLDVDNLQSARSLRLVLEGRTGCFEPVGSSDDPSQALPLRRVLAAVSAAGLVIEDVFAVPDTSGGFGDDFCKDLFNHGLLSFDWVDGSPPARFWLSCRKAPLLAGSVILAGGDPAARRRTRECVAAYLPEQWEVVEGEGVLESAQWNRGIAAARGEVVWLLRGGSTPSEELFVAQSVRAGIGAVAPSVDDVRCNQGDIAGLMMPRVDLLLLGPVPESYTNTQVAIEEYCMRMGAKFPEAQLVPHAFAVPAIVTENAPAFADETEGLFRRWSALAGGDAPRESSAAVAEPPSSPVACPWIGRKPRVSLCMITRNEERFLPRCLELAKDAVDEIVIVDTGSTDRTVQIAESFGARVLHQPWDDDFATPRTTGLRAATGDWILVLDADEFIQDGGCARIRELVENPRISGYHLHFVNVYGKGRTMGVMMVRLFRNLPGLEYQNVIHEQVTPSLQRAGAAAGLVISSANVVVDHHGYSDEVMDQRGKNERNERLFKKQLQQRPDCIYTHYKYGDFLRRLPGRGAEALAELEQCLRMILDGPPSLPRGLPFAGEVAALCALESARAGNTVRARAVLDTALRRFLPTPNLHYLSASLALADGRAEDAIHHYRRCLSYRGQVLVVPIQEGITSYVSLTGIAQAWLLRGDTQRARRLLEQAIAIEPSYEVAQLVLSRLWLQQGDLGRALHVMTSYLAAHPDSPGACQQTTLILQRLGHKAEAKRMGQHAVRLLEARALDHEAAAMNEVLAAI